LLAALIVVGLVAGDDSSKDGPPLSPSSTSGGGTRALVLLLEESGGSVRTAERLPPASSHVALLLRDGLDGDSRDQLRAWIDGGGTLVVADPLSPFSAPTIGFFGSGPDAGRLDRGTCDVPGIDDVNELQVTVGFEHRVGAAPSCFGDGESAFIVRRTIGRGAIVSIGGTDVFTNSGLDEADNSVLAVRLLLPADGTSITILDPNAPGSGRTSLEDLIADRVFQALLQLCVAFVVYALWRSRRLGRPVLEPQPVAIAGSQFVRAVGGLQQRSHSTERAAAVLRADTRRVLCERFGMPFNLDADSLAELTATRTGLDRNQVAAALGDTPILDEPALVALGQQLDAIREHALAGREEVLDGRSR
jgi:hypothetical protein